MSLLSKSEYMMFLKHPAWLWLKKHDKDKFPVIDDNCLYKNPNQLKEILSLI